MQAGVICKIFSHYYLSAVPNITPLIVRLWGTLNDPGEEIGWGTYHGALWRFGAAVNYQKILKHFNILTTVQVIQVHNHWLCLVSGTMLGAAKKQTNQQWNWADFTLIVWGNRLCSIHHTNECMIINVIKESFAPKVWNIGSPPRVRFRDIFPEEGRTQAKTFKRIQWAVGQEPSREGTAFLKKPRGGREYSMFEGWKESQCGLDKDSRGESGSRWFQGHTQGPGQAGLRRHQNWRIYL